MLLFESTYNSKTHQYTVIAHANNKTEAEEVIRRAGNVQEILHITEIHGPAGYILNSCPLNEVGTE